MTRRFVACAWTALRFISSWTLETTLLTLPTRPGDQNLALQVATRGRLRRVGDLPPIRATNPRCLHPKQDIRSLQRFCEHANHHFIPPPTCNAHTLAIVLQDYCAIYAPLPTPLLYATHHTILVIAISCRGQRLVPPPAGNQTLPLQTPTRGRLRLMGGRVRARRGCRAPREGRAAGPQVGRLLEALRGAPQRRLCGDRLRHLPRQRDGRLPICRRSSGRDGDIGIISIYIYIYIYTYLMYLSYVYIHNISICIHKSTVFDTFLGGAVGLTPPSLPAAR